MAEYRVTWEIDIDADSPREAVERAHEIQQDPYSTAKVFIATNSDGQSVQIDLWPEEEEL